MKPMTPQAAWGWSEGNSSSQREGEEGDEEGHVPHAHRRGVMLPEQATCSCGSSLPGKSRQVTLVTPRPGEGRGGGRREPPAIFTGP